MASGISPLGVSGDAVHPCTANHTDSRSPLPMVGTQGIPGSDGKLRAMKSHTHIATLGKDLVKAKDVHRLVVISDRHDQTVGKRCRVAALGELIERQPTN